MSGRGRPMKYAELIKALDLDLLYAPSTIIANAEELGLFTRPELRGKNVREKSRGAMNRMAAVHFSSEADGLIETPGRAPMRGWYGWRWKAAIPAHFFEEDELLEIEKRKKEPRQSRDELLIQRRNRRDKKRGKRIRTSRVGARHWALALIIGLSTFGLGMVVSSYTTGVRVFLEQGPRAGLAYFRSAERAKTMEPRVVFGQAWATYAMGDYSEAERQAIQLIRDRRTPKPVLGNGFFLLGKVQTRTGQFEEGHENLEKAFMIYEQLGKYGNLFKTSCALAEISIALGNADGADHYLEQALRFNDFANANLGGYYHLEAELAFLRGEYQHGLEFSYLSHEAYATANMANNMADALIDIGFYLVLTGRSDEGFETSMAAQELIHKTGDQDKHYYNLVNFIMIRRCEGKSIEGMVGGLRKHNELSGNWKLRRLLEFALTFDCSFANLNPARGGEGSDEPPDTVVHSDGEDTLGGEKPGRRGKVSSGEPSKDPANPREDDPRPGEGKTHRGGEGSDEPPDTAS